MYRAEVVFPTSGRWSYAVDDGFISERQHTFPAVQIGAETSAPAAATGDDGGGPSAGWLVPGVALLLVAAALLARDRRRHRHPQAA